MGFKDWRYGLHELIQKEINSLGFPDGSLLEVSPPYSSLDSMVSMQRVLYLLQQYPGRFSLEIWKDDKIGFRFFCSLGSVEGMLKGQLSSVYPNVVVKRSEFSLPDLKEGEYVSACSLILHGVELNLKRSGDFSYDPLRHVLEAINSHDSKILIQILFERINKIPKNKRIVLEQKYGDDLFFRNSRVPVLKCLVRIAAISRDKFIARESCAHIARTFSVFDTDRAHLVPKIVSFPLVKNSYNVLSGMAKRTFPFFSDCFLISVQELTSMVHLPVGAESSGVKYSKPTIAPSNLPW
jgi:hypothetical protein